MQQDFCTTLDTAVIGRTAFVGIGNTARGDDGFGVYLAEALRASGVENVFIARTMPENYITALIDGRFDSVVLIDAVSTDADAGSVVLMPSDRIKGRFPQVSTHKLSLGTLARLIETESSARVWLLGIQPATLREASGLSDTARTTLEVLHRILRERINRRMPIEAECINT